MPLISSCVALAAFDRTYEVPPERLQAAVLKALAGHEDLERSPGLVVTGWGPERDGPAQGIFLGRSYVFRERFRVSQEGSRLSVTASVERRAPGGPRSRQWERVDGEAAAQRLLDEVARLLAESK